MCTTHDRIGEICDIVRAHPERYADFKFFPCMPYAHKYANAITDDGFLGAIRRFLPSEGLLDSVVRGTKSLAGKDVEGIVTLLIDAELKMFAGLSTPVIWMQNVVVDLLLGLGFDEAFQIFADHVRNRYGAEPGFITMNLPRLLDTLDRVGVDNPIVCSNINKLGSGCRAASKPTSTRWKRAGSAPWRCRSSPVARSTPVKRSSGCASCRTSSRLSSVPPAAPTSPPPGLW